MIMTIPLFEPQNEKKEKHEVISGDPHLKT